MKNSNQKLIELETNMETNFGTGLFSRKRILKFINGLTVEQLNKIPEGLDHNIIWNIGHILAMQQIFIYKKAGLPFIIKDEIVEKYRSGSSVSTAISEDEINYLKNKLLDTVGQIQEDYKNGKFKNYSSFVTKPGVAVDNIEDAISFHAFHEGVHLGWIWQIKKLV
jgi:DinB superfamily